MAIHSTGAISFQDLINEFNVPKPLSLSQMYAGGDYVPEANTGVPKSGAISLGNFYGATAALVINHNITADMVNFNSSTVLANYSWDGVTPVILTVTIANGIIVSGDNTSTPAFIVNALPSGSQVFINNNGFIIGMGGHGGDGGSPPQAGASGGIALNTLTNIVITNAGTIGGGGGGGGGGVTSGSFTGMGTSGGGGGQSGRVNSGGGYGKSTGSQGSFASAGAGGRYSTSKGGAGGTWGVGGAAGMGVGGGAGGAAVVGNSLINWVSVGTISGSLLN